MTEQNINPHLYAIIVGEASGDTLGAGLMKAILRHDPQAKFIGIGGQKMCRYGMVSAFKMEDLSVMGLFEVIKHAIPILKIRKKITNILLEARPCVMIGIDAPDFNLTVERKLRANGIKTIHYVSPSVWAWREGRMKTIQEACEEVLALLPFEKEFYDRVGMPCTYVGHTLANSIELEVDQKTARERIGFYKNCVDPINGKVLAILPGSRSSVINRMLPIYARTAQILREQQKDLTFVSVAPSHDIAVLIKDVWLQYAPDISLTVFVNNTQDVIVSADACLLTCGTIAFEAMLLKKPMVVAYKVSPLSAMIARKLLKVNMYSLPNLLANRELVKELIQENCTPENLAKECLSLLTSDNLLLKKEFLAIHKSIKTNADELAAKAVLRIAHGEDCKYLKEYHEISEEDLLKNKEQAVKVLEGIKEANFEESESSKTDLDSQEKNPESSEITKASVQEEAVELDANSKEQKSNKGAKNKKANKTKAKANKNNKAK